MPRVQSVNQWHKNETVGNGNIYIALYVMFLMRADPLLGQVGGGWALEISSFLGPK
jgi:hypothetical protein